MERKILAINDNPKIIGNVMILLGSLGKRLLNSRENDFTTYAALCFDMLNNRKQLTVHCHFFAP